ncbi:MAG: DUF4150 domain-containing protein [Deltaproteobacteria bacterium]|nr:DUF4150 domain-containing protein [Deltaproteobacteria bacterium]
MFADSRSIVHKGDGLTLSAAAPNVCKIQGPGGAPLPIPFGSISKTSDLAQGTQSVRIAGSAVAVTNSQIASSSGDEAGRLGGIISNKNGGALKWLSGSPDVRFEGEPVVCYLDIALANGNSFNTVVMTPGSPSTVAERTEQAESGEFPTKVLAFNVENFTEGRRPNHRGISSLRVGAVCDIIVGSGAQLAVLMETGPDATEPIPRPTADDDDATDPSLVEQLLTRLGDGWDGGATSVTGRRGQPNYDGETYVALWLKTHAPADIKLIPMTLGNCPERLDVREAVQLKYKKTAEKKAVRFAVVHAPSPGHRLELRKSVLGEIATALRRKVDNNLNGGLLHTKLDSSEAFLLGDFNIKEDEDVGPATTLMHFTNHGPGEKTTLRKGRNLLVDPWSQPYDQVWGYKGHAHAERFDGYTFVPSDDDKQRLVRRQVQTILTLCAGFGLGRSSDAAVDSTHVGVRNGFLGGGLDAAVVPEQLRAASSGDDREYVGLATVMDVARRLALSTDSALNVETGQVCSLTEFNDSEDLTQPYRAIAALGHLVEFLDNACNGRDGNLITEEIGAYGFVTPPVADGPRRSRRRSALLSWTWPQLARLFEFSERVNTALAMIELALGTGEHSAQAHFRAFISDHYPVLLTRT